MKEKACFVCMANCVRLHGDADEDADDELSPAGSSGPELKENGASEPQQKKTVATEVFPSFLKKMTELAITSALQMPASFVKASIANIGRAVTLEGPGKGKWRVETGTGQENHSFEFRDGWLKFVVDHSLQIGDQLSFTLTAGSYFQVVVYDESGSQKVSAIDASNVPLKHDQLDANGAKIDAAALVRPKPVSRPKQMVRKKPRTEGVVQSLNLVPPVVHSSDSELRNSNTSENNSKEIASAEKSDGEPDKDESRGQLPPALLPPHVLLGGHVISHRRSVTAEEKERALNAAKALRIANPKLVVVMSKAYVYKGFWMSLSRPFAKEYMPHVTRDVTLLNMAGNEWTVKWLYKDTASGFSAGWRGFALDHRLEESDVCVFEVVDKENFVIIVHIIRVIGAPKEDDGDYRPIPGRARNANQPKRKMPPDYSPPGPSSSKKLWNNGKDDSPANLSEIEPFDHSLWQSPPKAELPSCSKRAPNFSAKVIHGISSPGIVPAEALPSSHEEKKVKCSPTNPLTVHPNHDSFVASTPADVENANHGSFVALPLEDVENVAKDPYLDVPAVNPKQAETPRENLLKLGKELAEHRPAKSVSPSSPSPSHGIERVQISSPNLDKDLTLLLETCVCLHTESQPLVV